MATTVFFRGNDTQDNCSPGMHLGFQVLSLTGFNLGHAALLLSTTRGVIVSPGFNALAAATVTGPTTGSNIPEMLQGAFYSMPLSANVTIAGSITVNMWAFENNMSANAAINVLLERISVTGTVVSEIGRSARSIEMAVTTAAVNNFTFTPTSTNMLKGERIKARIFMLDGGGTMATGFSGQFNFAAATGAGNGDSFLTFTETFTFQTSAPAGTQMFLTSTAGPAVGANTELEMWTSRGGGVTTAIVNSVLGWSAPVQFTVSAGGAAVEWYSRRLNTFTLAGLVRLNMRLNEGSTNSVISWRAELATCDNDGTNVTVWAANCIIDTPTLEGAWRVSDGQHGAIPSNATGELVHRGWIAGQDLVVGDGQRLRLRIFIDDTANGPVFNNTTATLRYNGTSGGASGDAYIQLGQSVTEFTPPSALAPPVVSPTRRILPQLVR